VLRALLAAGIRPEVVAGSSSGAVVGAVYAAGALDHFEQWGRGLDWRQIVGYMDVSLRGGLIKARRLFDTLAQELPGGDIADLPLPFACVATDLGTGREIWIREGPLLDSLRASMALPGLITPVSLDGQWLVDGGVVNPVPVSLCRAMGADTVIAVDLNTTLLQRRMNSNEEKAPAEMPSLYDVIANSLNIMQVRVTRSRMAGDPPELLVTPRLADFALLDFDRADEAIAEGVRAVARALGGNTTEKEARAR
jgi:NTE family protein